MFGPNNTMTMKVMSMKEDGEELMVEKRVITEMVYWDMVGHAVLTSLKSQMLMLQMRFKYLQGRVLALVILVALLLLGLWVATTVIQHVGHRICICLDCRPLSVPFLLHTSGKGTDVATPLGLGLGLTVARMMHCTPSEVAKPNRGLDQ